MRDFFELTKSGLTDWLLSEQKAGFHADQIFDWVYAKGTRRWDEMTNLNQELRALLSRTFKLDWLTLDHVKQSHADTTIKFSWRLHDQSVVDNVLTKRELQLSTQVGCPGKCKFCASGKKFVRNLRLGEMLDQVLLLRESRSISKIRFAGMGEPFKNPSAVLALIERLLEWYEADAIELSTIGIIDGITQLMERRIGVRLSVGLHAPNQRLRTKLVPYAAKNSLLRLIEVLEEYGKRFGQTITLDYILIEGLNDHPDHAFELANLIRRLRARVRLIPFNPTPGLTMKKPSPKAIKEFRTVLFGNKIPHAVDEPKGIDIRAALGQLVL